MRRDDVLLRLANLSIAALLALAGPSMAIAAADPGGSHGNGGNNNPGKAGANQSGASRGNGGANSGNGGHRNSGGNSSVSGQTNTGNSSKSIANGNGNGNGGRNNFAPGAQSNSGSDGPDAALPTPANPPVPVVVAEQHTGTAPAGRSSRWSAPDMAPPVVEVPAPSAPSEEGAADLLSADHTGIPVWAAAEPIGVRGDLFGLAGLVLMPLVGLAVGYRQAKAARDVGLTIRP